MELTLSNHFGELIAQGGIMMFPLGLCSVLMVAVILERWWGLRQSLVFPKSELEKMHRELANKSLAVEAHHLEPTHPVGRILIHGLSTLPGSSDRFKEAMQEQARRELHGLERGLVWLEIIVGIAPLFGLLGTALGMIEVFSNISADGTARTEALSSGIAQALLTTVFGLAVAIPALIMYNLFSRRVESFALEMEREAQQVYHRIFPEAE